MKNLRILAQILLLGAIKFPKQRRIYNGMRATIYFLAILIFIKCDNGEIKNSNLQAKEYKFYDFSVTVEIYDPFKGLTTQYHLMDSNLVIIERNNTSSKKGIDSSKYKISKPELDSIYKHSSALFTINSNNLSKDSIPKPPLGEGHYAKVIFDLIYRGDKFIREVKLSDTIKSDSFSKLYGYLNKK